MTIRPSRIALPAVIACALFSGCLDSGGGTTAPATTAPTAAASTPALPATHAGALVAADADGKPAWTVIVDGGHVEVAAAGGARYVGEKQGDKRRWRNAADGSAVLEVKDKDDGFKLRTPDDARLLWKVKLADDKIKISDNEENLRPFALKTGYEDKAKALAQDESELGEVKFYGDRSKVKTADGGEAFVIDGARRSAAWGVLLFEGIPQPHRGILLAELLARGK